MNIQEKLKNFASRIESMRENIKTEEATKTSLIMPFFQIMGYDVFNPAEFTPEFVADVGIKKGEKVDYAILIDEKPVILIECKNIGEKLERHDSQLYRYFGTTTAKFAILTNGIVYRFYTDIDETNKMDEAPFLEIDLLNIKDHLLLQLSKFTKDSFNENEIFSSAAELKYMNQIRLVIKNEMSTPSDELTRLILSYDIYDGVKTQNIVDKFKPLVKQSFTLVINEIISERLKSAIGKEEADPAQPNAESLEEPEESHLGILTTQEELDSFFLIKGLLRKHINANRISYQDKETYFAILIDGKITKWICRLYFRERTQYIVIPNQKEHVRHDFKEIDDIYKFEELLINRLNELL